MVPTPSDGDTLQLGGGIALVHLPGQPETPIGVLDTATGQMQALPITTVRAFAFGVGSFWLAGYTSDDEASGSRLFEYDLADKRWSTHSSEYSDLPEGDIHAITHAAGAMWLAATDGVARYDVTRQVWEPRWLVMIDSIDSARYELSDVPPVADPIGTSIDVVLMAFGLLPTPQLIHALRGADPIPLLEFAKSLMR